MPGHAAVVSSDGRRLTGHVASVTVLCVALLLVGVGCGATTAGTGPPSSVADTTSVPPGSRDNDVTSVSTEESQAINVSIYDGRFDSSVYRLRTGAARIYVRTDGRAYTLSIEYLVTSRHLPPDSVTELNMTFPSPGDYDIWIEGGGQATLSVRRPGGF